MMTGVSDKGNPLLRATVLAVLFYACVMLQGLNAQQAGTNPEVAREEWFFNQRRYGLGYIPDDALAKAVAQRDGGKVVPKASLAANLATDQPHAITQGRWTSYGPNGISSTLNDLVS